MGRLYARCIVQASCNSNLTRLLVPNNLSTILMDNPQNFKAKRPYNLIT